MNGQTIIGTIDAVGKLDGCGTLFLRHDSKLSASAHSSQTALGRHVTSGWGMHVCVVDSSTQILLPMTHAFVSPGIVAFATQRAVPGGRCAHSGSQSGGTPSQSVSVSGTKNCVFQLSPFHS
jgi:hypothetical protein